MTAATDAAQARPVKTVGLISLGHFTNHTFNMLIPPMVATWVATFDVSYAMVGLLMTVGALTSVVAQMPVGFLVDRVPVRWVLIGGLALMSVAVAGMALATSYWMLLPLVALAGLGNTVFHPSDYTILSAAVPQRWLGRAFSVHTFAGYVGFAFAPAFIGLSLATWGWRTGLALLGVGGLVMAAVLVFNRRDLRDDVAKGAEAPVPHKGGGGLKSGLALLSSLPIVLCFLFFFMVSTAHLGFDSFLPAALNLRHGTPEELATFSLTVFFAASALGILIGGMIADRTERHGLVACCGFGMAAVLIVLVGEISAGSVVLFALIAAAGLATGIVPPSRDLIVRKVTPPGQTGKVFAFMTVAMDSAYAIAPPIYGWILDNGWTRAIFWLTAVLFLMAIATVGGTRRASFAGERA